MRTIIATASPGASVGNRVDRVLLGLLRLYKLIVSPFFAGSCRFQPSCADYAREAVIVHGASRGTWLTVKRLCRCHPLCRGGFDPVPVPTRSKGL